MTLDDISSSMTTAALQAAYDDHAEPFASVEQVDVFLRVASILRRRLPEESEGLGSRITLRDLDYAINEARRQKGILSLTSQPATVIVPPDRLR